MEIFLNSETRCVTGVASAGSARVERSRLRRRKGMLGEWWESPPPFLHADSEHAGVSPAVSAQS